MAPLILHNVPDDELYVGEDGKQRPYAMLFPQHDGHHAATGARGRRVITETGSFGKSARRSRSKTATPARREDPTLAAADKVFGSWFDKQREQNTAVAAAATAAKAAASASSSSTNGTPTPQRGANGNAATPTSNGASQTEDESGTTAAAAAETPSHHFVKKVPVEVVLRGYRSAAQQYAAINHYEQLAGAICEDYHRDPPAENRRYRSELRDPAFTRRRPLTPEERALVNRADGGEHWVKVTFESMSAAEAAMSVSPQRVLGHLIYAEPYQGMPPARDEACPDLSTTLGAGELLSGAIARTSRSRSQQQQPEARFDGGSRGRGGSRSLAPAASMASLPGRWSSSGSQTSSRTAESGTVVSYATTNDSATVTSGTVTGGAAGALSSSPPTAAAAAATATSSAGGGGAYLRRIPTVRRVNLLPPEQALLPQQSYLQRVLNAVPFLKWFSGSMIGNEVPRTDSGDFDWDKASLYWKLIWWLDATFKLFGGEILSADKDD